MEFVPVPGTKVLFCRTETRVKDFEAFANATDYERDKERDWRKPGFEQGPDHPVVNVCWNDARAFCEWLSKKEGVEYRLPTDEEWGAAVGPGKYPWGNDWPPPKGAGNYAVDKSDSAKYTAPVASYTANRLGIFDLGGNAWEWCEDEWKPAMNEPDAVKELPSLKEEKDDDGTAFRRFREFRVMRGASWIVDEEFLLRSSYRNGVHRAYRENRLGFRCVLVVSAR